MLSKQFVKQIGAVSTSQRLNSRSFSHISKSNRYLNQISYSRYSPFGRFSNSFSTANNGEKTTEAKEEEPTKSEDNAEVEAEASEKETDAVAEELEIVKTELKETKEKLLLTLAESENVRKRSQKDVDVARTYAIQSFAKQLLEISDNLKRAIESVPAEEIEKNDANATLKALFEGVDMTRKELGKVFQKNNLVEFGEVGDQFNPHLHNARFNMPDPEKEKNTVGQVITTGYKFGDRVLRPADVGIIQ